MSSPPLPTPGPQVPLLSVQSCPQTRAQVRSACFKAVWDTASPLLGSCRDPCPPHCPQRPGTAPLTRHHPAGPLLNLRAVVLEQQGPVPWRCSPRGVSVLPCSRLGLGFWLLGWAQQSAHRPDCALVGVWAHPRACRFSSRGAKHCRATISGSVW